MTKFVCALKVKIGTLVRCGIVLLKNPCMFLKYNQEVHHHMWFGIHFIWSSNETNESLFLFICS